MVRKTKAESEQTKRAIIAAACRVFAKRGVSRTTLAQIAKAAGVTRGAIYWHFANKPALFFAVLEQVSLPILDRMDANVTSPNNADPLESIRQNMHEVLALLEQDKTANTTFEIISLKCEYVDEFEIVDSQVLEVGYKYIQKLTIAYQLAEQLRQLRDNLSPAQLALDSYVFMKGLIRVWLADKQSKVIRAQAHALIDAHITMRKA